MKVCILYRSNSEHARRVEEFIRDFKRAQATRRIESLDLDTREGSSVATLYDIMEYPAILALADDGQLLRAWQGDKLPLMDEVAYYSQD